jgi:hypothetical protein
MVNMSKICILDIYNGLKVNLITRAFLGLVSIVTTSSYQMSHDIYVIFVTNLSCTLILTP